MAGAISELARVVESMSTEAVVDEESGNQVGTRPVHQIEVKRGERTVFSAKAYPTVVALPDALVFPNLLYPFRVGLAITAARREAGRLNAALPT